jgi:microcystin-dependent protein
MGLEICPGHILLFAGSFAPVGWLPCDGRELPIRDYMTLFSIVGTTYGGDGITNFALPNFPNMQQATCIIAVGKPASEAPAI